MIEKLIEQLQKELELKGPLGEGSTYTLGFDEQSITISEHNEGIELSTTIGEHPKDMPELFFVKMLRGNLFGQATFDGVLGLDETGTKIVLQAYINEPKATYKQFKEKLEDFMNAIDFWKKEIILHEREPNTP